ncbi:hypothetical protein QOL99_05565 [Deinococcus sp. MIMF12]|uniref:Sacsin/Nov domain-containing protein n=1 Tax=Deinococcus rhizophilus TaxID=3049544 RepID=A0ABT7JEY0_9DEIO|nr:hypothetical protein [Deinococcus rhizophilus]MDL2343617.1 hypothetical protein [Deinococcus rhizophilus]
MGRLRHHYLSDISTFRSLFNADTPLFLILKELVQNADDSGAGEMYVGYSAGLPDAEHPLLRGPGLFVSNDGPFTRDDAEAIVRFGLSTKGSDSSTVGKFGLGLKSVFAVAEAFFYIDGAREPDLVWDPPHYDVINPWHDPIPETAHHADWDTFTRADRAAVLARLAALGVPPGFTVWVPLRRAETCRSQRTGEPLYIVNRAPGDHPFEIGVPLQRELGALFPLLKGLSRITVVQPDGSRVLERHGTYRTADLKAMPPGRRPLVGRVLTVPGGETATYQGVEVMLDPGDVEPLRTSDYWPRTNVITLTESRQEPDPSIGHGAAVWHRAPASEKEGRLTIQWGVFLPLQNPEVRPLASSAFDYTLTLHGYFFLKSDRKTLYAWEPSDVQTLAIRDEETLRRKWNALVASRATLPQVLAGLATLEAQVDDAELGALTRELHGSALYGARRAELCAQAQWVRRVSPEGERWALIDADQPVLPVPVAPDLTTVFPALEQISREHVVVRAGAPSLTNPRQEVEHWPAALLGAMLASVSAADVATDAGRSRTFLDVWRRVGRHASADALVAFVRRALQQGDLAALRRQPELLRGLLDRIPADRVLALPAGLGRALERQVVDAATEILVVPADFLSRTFPGQVSLNDALVLAGCLDGSKGTAELIRLLLDRVTDADALRQFLDDRPVLTVTALGAPQTTQMTPRQVRDLASQGRAFRHVGEPELLTLLQKALAGADLLLVKPEVLGALSMLLPEPTGDSVASTVLAAQQLGPVEARRALLEELLRSHHQHLRRPDFTQALRYLFHGRPERRGATERLLVCESREAATDALWKATLKLAGHLPDGWCVVDEPVAFLSPAQKEALKVVVLAAGSFQDLVRSRPELVKGEILGKDLASQLVVRLPDLDLLRRLPIHRSAKGEWVTVGPQTYLKGKFELDDFVRDRVTLLAEPEGEVFRKRMEDLVPIFGPSHAWDIVQGQGSDAHRHWETGLRALESWTGFMTGNVRTTRWVPLKGGGACSPNDLLTWKDWDEQLARLREASVLEAYCWEDLDPVFAGHELADVLRSVTPRAEPTLKKAAELLGRAPDYHVGRLETPVGVWLDVFAAHGLQDFPLAELLRTLPEDGIQEPEQALDQLYRAAKVQLPADRLVEALRVVHAASVSGGRADQRTKVAELYTEYLAELRGTGERDAYLPQLRLLNRLQEWCSPDTLCLVGDDFVPTAVLAEAHRDALYTPDEVEERVFHEEAGSAESGGDAAGEDTAQLLRDFVAEWEPYVPEREYLGGFLALLDGNVALHRQAQLYLPTSVENVRIQALSGLEPDQLANRRATSLVELLEDVRIEIEEVVGEVCRVPNLLGQDMEVAFKDDSELESVLVFTGQQRPSWSNRDYVYRYPFSLKRVDLTRADLNLPDLLLRSVKVALKRINKDVLPPELDRTWQGLASSTQVQIGATQLTVLRRAIGMWGRQLGLEKDSPVRRLLDRLGSLEGREDEATEQGIEAKLGDVREELQHLRRELRTLIEQDIASQDVLLDGVRRKVDEQQYEPSSVLFELFQNADDALSEWRGMGAPVGPARQTVVVQVVDDVLRFAHWGRAINCYTYGSFNGRDDARQYDQDLVKMLTLLASDKTAEGAVTGHFGLGFKSVFLVSDEPSVTSGRLSFDILGGVYPAVPPQGRVDDLRQALAELSPAEATDGTLIDLPLREGLGKDAVLKRFVTLAPVMLAFAREVRHLRVEVDGETVLDAVWDPAVLRPGVACGRMTLQGETFAALALGGGEVQMLLQVDRQGVASFGAGLPSIWVTVPTKETVGTGFLVNGMFPLDPGRAQLARNDALQDTLAAQWAPELAAALEQLQLLGEDWETLQTALALAPDVTPYGFWKGVWERLAVSLQGGTQETSAPHRLLTSLLWTSGGSLRKVYMERPLLPTGLQGAYKGLTAVRQTLRPLDRHLGAPAVFGAVASWPEFQRAYSPGTLIAAEVRTTLDRLGFPPGAARVTLIDALRTLLPDGRITPGVAGRVGSVLQGDVLYELRDADAGREWLAGLTFLSADGEYREGRALLTRQADPGSDEAMRARIAPPHALLDDGYDDVGLSLFRRLRGQPRERSDETLAWVLQAPEERQGSALEYLMTLPLRDPVRESVEEGRGGTWLDTLALANNPVLDALDSRERQYLDAVLGTPPEAPEPGGHTIDDLLRDFGDDAVETVDTAGAPERLYAWWEANRERYVARYDEAVYPGGHPFVTEPDFDEDDQDLRRRWTALLVLGTLQSMGRARPQQHAAFLAMCERQGWLDVFSSPHASDGMWMGVVHSFLEGGVDRFRYYHWMRQFVAIHQVSRWLREYALALLEADKFPQVTYDELLAPRTNPQLQGTDLDAPPLQEALGIGGVFVVRELLRQGVLGNPALAPLAYVPGRRVRALVEALSGTRLPEGHGDASRRIHGYLAAQLGPERATFLGDYDLPLLVLAGAGDDDQEAVGLQRELLGGTLRVDLSRIEVESSDSGWVTLPDGRRVFLG